MKSYMKAREIAGALRKAGIEEAEREAEEILCHVLGVDRTALYVLDPEVPDIKYRLVTELIKRRTGREPLQYLLGEVEFYGLRIKVGRGVLIPRPETEILVETLIGETAKRFSARFTALDLCTGSGCIAIAIGKAFPRASVSGVDLSSVALGFALANREANCVDNVSFASGNLFEPVDSAAAFDVIVSNPPYVPQDDLKTLQPEIRLYEPMEALDGGEDGLSFYRRIIGQAPRYLNPGGLLFLEMGAGQGVKIKEMALASGFKSVLIKKDYAGIERIVIID
ncbi:MAG: peptide chain release factor N(5)-glutamine methyltransferase [Nitrospirae bacterium]|nr:peptide chain release factor N(5)-glutamine methyltransferase [Nitrospirota bacterium]